MKGKLIVITGIDGSGKSTLIKNLDERLTKKGLKVGIFRNHEPFSQYWQTVKQVKDYLQQEKKGFPYEIDRVFQAFELAQKCREELPDLIKQKDIILSDRYIIDRILYGNLRGDMGLAQEILRSIPYKPDMTIFLDVSIKTALKRIREKGGAEDWKEEPAMLRQAYDSYRRLLSQHPDFYRINGEQDPRSVADDALETLKREFTIIV